MSHSAATRARQGQNVVQFLPVAPLIRIMIVDDSPVARAVLSRMISAHRDLEVVALAGTAGEALDALKAIKVDIVLLDVEMPGTTGLQALPDIVRLGDGARVLVVSSFCEEGAEANVKALALGAADTLPKPGAGNFAGRFSDVLAERLRRIGRAGVERTGEEAIARQEAASIVTLRAMPDRTLGCIALGASTGGLHALNEFLCALPSRIGAPIFITQHLPVVFMPVFARQIETASGRATRVGEEGMVVQPEEIIVAPGDAHLGLRRDGNQVRIALSDGPARSGCKPSVDPMLESVREIYGEGAVAVILSGMGRDGLDGSLKLVKSGGAVLAQDEGSSAVWGMPRAVAEAGLASAVLPPADLAKRLAARIAGAAWK
ncbi:chemotaxis-specific protein-glutamate methyltransferase CheB [Sphingosinicella rhizophila]|uniref:Protein-glutamate methylesterase/protein-glutamine glutaminase n=1 Tax=Sphingosinicella rhizophila TaxID=3050082 RepID=A0ABU3Q2A0_9SPHN|nr:chemotaxis-specific protein-glutamate methyltransferase CheB [Sphingosinicella sp. GR2756]MDT9597549.1 chemotaxis-specific protein-glutamate methyltransferase CheB [Sphingosinicella sp. GR2756]